MNRLFFAALFVVVTAAHADVDRSKQPAPGPEPTFTPPVPTPFTANGMQGLLVERHHLPIVELMIAWDLGDVLDPAGKEGMHSLCVDLVGESTKTLDKSALEDRKADIGATIAIGAGKESAQMMVRSVKERLPAALDLAASLLLEPGLRSEDLERLRAQRKANVIQSRGNADAAASRVTSPIFFGFSHPYGHIVTEKSLDAVTAQDCAKVAGQLKPEGARLIVVGDVTLAEITKLFGERLAAWKGKAPARPRIGPPRGALDGKTKATVYFVDVPGAQQSRIIVGHHGPSRGEKDYYATTLMAQVLGGGLPSRIVQNLRERNGYTYGARAAFNYGRSGSTMTVASSVRTDVTAKALREVMTEMKALATSQPATAAEIAREREGTVRALPSRFGTGSGTLGAISELVFFDLPLDTWARLPQEVTAVNEAAVAKAVKERLRTEDLIVVVAGDRGKVLPDLEALAKENLFGKNGLVIIDADGKRLQK